MGEGAVVRLRMDVKVDVSALVRVGVPALNETLHQCNLISNVTCGARLNGWFNQTQGCVRLLKLAFKPLRERPPLLARLCRFCEDLVINIGDVANVGDVEAVAAQPPNQHVKTGCSTKVTDVGHSLHRRATQVDTDLAIPDWHQVLERGRFRIVKTQIHGVYRTWPGIL